MSCAAAFVASPVSYDVLNQSFSVASGVSLCAEVVLLYMGNVFWFQSLSKIELFLVG